MTSVAGKNVVVTGIIPGESRITAQARLRDAGAFVADTVTKGTDLLITGAKVGKAKTTKAEALGVAVVPWEQIRWNDGDTVGRVDYERLAEYDATRPAPRGLIARQIAPMLCKEGDLPTGPGWTHEIKWDGFRCVATIKGGAVSMASRSSKTDYALEFPHIAAELAALPDCVLDGEIVVLDNGQGGVMADLRGATKGTASFIVFDAIEVGTKDLRSEPLSERRIVVADVLTAGPKLARVTQSPVFPDGPVLLAYCVSHHLEGVVSKQLSSRYEDGGRSGAWVKTKVRPAQEFIVVGYTAGEGRRDSTFGALLLGYYSDDGQLVYAGKVGTGWDDLECDRLHALLLAAPHTPGVSPLPPFVPKDVAGDAVWVDASSLVVQVEFQRWTKDGVLWHPSYQGQRHDKDPADVRRES